MGSGVYWKARKDTIKLVNELKNDLPTALTLLGKAMGKTSRAIDAAGASAEARIDKGLATRMMDDFLESQSPWAKMLLDYGKNSIPYLKEHPELITQIVPLAQQFFGARAGEGQQRTNKKEPFLGLQR